ncbi:hypothetical protein, partial [Nocardia abscessus]|uniref:hypothetical protein n=1 Tax=Nocardia abscessus TaxID=120957 RepID=UPI0024551D91
MTEHLPVVDARSHPSIGSCTAITVDLAVSRCKPRALCPALDCRSARRTATPGFERSESEHAPFAARLASEWPPRPRRSRQR